MKMTIFGLILLGIVSCNQKGEPTFFLQGETNNLENGTVLYLETNLSNSIIDSAVVKDNEFKFSTRINNFPARTLLRTKDYSQRRDIWLENNPMIFDASESDFKNATVKGSESENLSEKLYENTDKLSFEERNKLEKQFVEENPNSIISAFILSVFSRDWGRDFTTEYFEKFSEEIKISEYGKKISNYLVLNKNIQVGDRYLDFEMADRNGDLHTISDLKGKTILLEFWAAWCKPCREENPNLVKTYEKFNPEGFEIYAVSLDRDKTKWIKAIEHDGLNWINVSDLKFFDGKASLIYGVNEIPDNFLIDSTGIIIERNIRGEKLNEKLKEIM